MTPESRGPSCALPTRASGDERRPSPFLLYIFWRWGRRSPELPPPDVGWGGASPGARETPRSGPVKGLWHRGPSGPFPGRALASRETKATLSTGRSSAVTSGPLSTTRRRPIVSEERFIFTLRFVNFQPSFGHFFFFFVLSSANRLKVGTHCKVPPRSSSPVNSSSRAT